MAWGLVGHCDIRSTIGYIRRVSTELLPRVNHVYEDWTGKDKAPPHPPFLDCKRIGRKSEKQDKKSEKSRENEKNDKDKVRNRQEKK